MMPSFATSPASPDPRPVGRPRPPRRTARGARPLRRLGAVLLLALPGLGGCEDVVVRPADVASLEIVPAEAQVAVGSSVRLQTRALDAEGQVLSGIEVSWSSSSSGIAAVDGDGDVTGMAPGEAEIRANVGAVRAVATVVVVRPPAVVLGQTTLGFSEGVGSSDPPPVHVAVTNGGDLPLTGLAVTVDFGEGPTGWLTAVLQDDAAPTTVVVSVRLAGLQPGSYEATVEVDAASAPGGAAQLPVTLEVRESVPGAPTGPSAEVLSPLSIRVSWTDNTSSETGFEIQRRVGMSVFEPAGTVGANVTSWVDGSVEADRVYGYRVRACGSAGCSAYSVTATATTPPVAPASLAAAAVSTTSIQLSWSDASATETQFQIERRTGSGAYTQIAAPPAGSTGYTDDGLAPATGYTYRVRACNGGGCSPWSAEATASTAAIPVPAAPSGLTATAVAGPRIDLAWTDQSGSETSVEVERKVEAGEYGPLATLDANVTTYADTGVNPDSTYTYRVRACGAGGCSVPSNEAGATTHPLPPSGAAATATSNTSVRVTWVDQSRTEAEFRIEWKSGTGSFAEAGTAPADATSFDHTGRSPGTAYTYRVQACNAGGCSAWSAEVSATTPSLPVPKAPENLTAVATAGEAQITLAWSDESSDEEGFRVYRRAPGETQFTLLETLGVGVEDYTDGSVQPDGTYVYRVDAYAAGGQSPSSEASATTYPDAPYSLSATVASSSRIELQWADSAATETQFRVEQKTTGTFTQVGTTGPDVVTYAAQGLTAETTYTFRVRACNSGGCSGYTAEVSATTSATPAPAAPTGLSATTVSAARIDLTWTDQASDETLYRIERSVDGGEFVALPTTLSANATSYSDTGVEADHLYTYRVQACKAGDLCSDFSNEASATTPPVPPSGLAAAAVSASAIQLDWTDDVNTETSFQLERKPAGGTFAGLVTLGAGAETYLDAAGLSAETTYVYRIRSCNVLTCSAWSGEASATTHPLAPTNLAATATSATSIGLNWTDNSSSETTFRIERRDGGAGEFTEIHAVGAGVTGHTDTGLQPGTLYEYRVRACNTACSTYSNQASATTDAAPAAPSALSATATSTTTVDLAWTDNSTTEQEYRVERSPSVGAWTSITTLGPDITTFANGGLSPETGYRYRVRACSGGACSAWSNEAPVTTWIPAPTGLAVTGVTTSDVGLSWSDNSATETGFEVERRDGAIWTLVNTTGASQTTYSVTGLAAETTYAFRVRAVNAGDQSDPSGEVQATTSPPAPANVSASATSSTSIQLSWTDNASTETGFEIQSRTGLAAFAALTTATAGATGHLHTGLTAVTTYDYRIRTCRGSACSAWVETSATTDPVPAPAAPTGLDAVFFTPPDQVQLTWTDHATTETSYQVLRATGGGGPVLVQSLGADAGAWDDATVARDATYTYHVEACNAGGCTPSADAIVATPPAAPSDFQATADSESAITLTWTDASAVETYFEIERGTAPPTYGTPWTVGAGVTTYPDAGLAPSTTYYYRIRSCNPSGCSDRVEANATTLAAP